MIFLKFKKISFEIKNLTEINYFNKCFYKNELIFINKIAFNTITHKFWNSYEFEKIIFEELKKDKIEWIKFEKMKININFQIL